ncbi:DUF4310 family protein [Salmonella enterica subsp. enterica]|nr:DUF4310 family protein [Salmonella enterica subsp. enterica]
MEENKSGFGMPTGRSRSLLACSPSGVSPDAYVLSVRYRAHLTKSLSVAMLKAGMDTGAWRRGRRFRRQLLFARITKARWSEILDIGSLPRPAWGLGVPWALRRVSAFKFLLVSELLSLR